MAESGIVSRSDASFQEITTALRTLEKAGQNRSDFVDQLVTDGVIDDADVRRVLDIVGRDNGYDSHDAAAWQTKMNRFIAVPEQKQYARFLCAAFDILQQHGFTHVTHDDVHRQFEFPCPEFFGTDLRCTYRPHMDPFTIEFPHLSSPHDEGQWVPCPEFYGTDLMCRISGSGGGGDLSRDPDIKVEPRPTGSRDLDE